LSAIVVDASVALAWGFPDEASDYAERVLVALEGLTAVVPALWAVEITNAVLVAERRKRIRQPDIRRFVELLGELEIVMDAQRVTDSVVNIVPLGREYGLSAYDAAYLDVAMRHGAPLATLDANLRRAGGKAGIDIFRSA
jgi:predicted nucleic acid-binding protein